MESQFRTTLRQKIIDAQSASLPKLTHRDVWLPAVAGKAMAIIGMRRSGKSSFLWQLLGQRHHQGTPRTGLLYFSFEDERLSQMQASDPDVLLDEYYNLNPQWRTDRRCTFFLDEIQTIPQWELFVRRILDSENIELFISGSSAKLLSREVATSMRGRALEAIVTPFGFREALRHMGQEPQDTQLRPTQALHSMLNHALLDYLNVGGFPEAQGLDTRSRTQLLRSYIDVVLIRDVLERHNLSQPQVLRWLIQQLLANPGSAFSINKFHADLKSRGVAIGKESLHQMLTHLEDAFIINSIHIASDSVRRRQVNPKKVYPVDTGLMNLFAPMGKPNTGHALETAVFQELARQGATLSYLHTPKGYEVDFHAEMPDGQTWLVQVCWDLTDKVTLAREVRALEDAKPDWPHARRLLIALHSPANLQLPVGIELHRAPIWLLDPTAQAA